MPLRILGCFALLAAMALSGAVPARAGEITIFAAASLRDALHEIADAFAEQGGDAPRLSFAGSSLMARQIQLGAPADLFVSANPEWMDVLEKGGLLVPGSRFDLAGNALVVIAPAQGVAEPDASPPLLDADSDLAERLGAGRFAMALVDAVPAGIYGKAALVSLGLWESLAPRVAQVDNVRAALALVARGEAPLGIVYASDALAEPRVRVVATIEAARHPPIRYPAAQIAGSPARDSAAGFLAFLRGETARAILLRHGFALPPE